MKIARKFILPLLLSSFFFFPALYGSSVQAEAMYQISESELTTLEQNLQTLEAHSSQKQELLNQQQKQLAEAQSQLETANRQLEKSRELNKQTQKSLERANQSLTELEKEAKKKIRVKTRQRDLWIAISGGLLYAWIKK
jgi:septal ring factor EnvC (AmiA/AmiB activator)